MAATTPWRRRARKALAPFVFRKAKPAQMVINPQEVIRKQKLRELGYDHTMTLYGTVLQHGKLKLKRIEVLSQKPIRQVHNAFLYEVMVSQDLNNPATINYHAKYDILKMAHFKGIPKEDYVVLTWRELVRGSYEEESGEWVEYDQESG